ncbi:MAG: citrate lyase acyl carrier protein [Acidobacteriota bacterium]|jgi:citrate lyase subunit gamma (acyl carrier protein)|nr:citrate lyase acyl carrier protein [Acidobacteriota bacterium]
MQLKIPAQAGTLESSDALVMVEPAAQGSGRRIELESNVLRQYGRRIRLQVETTLDRLGVSDVRILVKDKGALDATVQARVETAIRRSMQAREAVRHA